MPRKSAVRSGKKRTYIVRIHVGNLKSIAVISLESISRKAAVEAVKAALEIIGEVSPINLERTPMAEEETQAVEETVEATPEATEEVAE